MTTRVVFSKNVIITVTELNRQLVVLIVHYSFLRINLCLPEVGRRMWIVMVGEIPCGSTATVRRSQFGLHRVRLVNRTVCNKSETYKRKQQSCTMPRPTRTNGNTIQNRFRQIYSLTHIYIARYYLNFISARFFNFSYEYINTFE